MFDFTHLPCLFLIYNDSKLVKIKQVYYKKLHASGKDNSIGAHDSDKVIFNYSSYKLCDIEKKVLVRTFSQEITVWKLARGYCLCYCKSFSLVPDSTECTKIFVAKKCSTLCQLKSNNIS